MAGAPGCEAIDVQSAVLDAGGERGILEHRVVLADDLRGQAGPRLMESLQLGIAALGGTSCMTTAPKG